MRRRSRLSLHADVPSPSPSPVLVLKVSNDNTGREISERRLFCKIERAHCKSNRTSKDQRKPLKFFIDENVVLNIAFFINSMVDAYMGALYFPVSGMQLSKTWPEK